MGKISFFYHSGPPYVKIVPRALVIYNCAFLLFMKNLHFLYVQILASVKILHNLTKTTYLSVNVHMWGKQIGQVCMCAWQFCGIFTKKNPLLSLSPIWPFWLKNLITLKTAVVQTWHHKFLRQKHIIFDSRNNSVVLSYKSGRKRIANHLFFFK